VEIESSLEHASLTSITAQNEPGAHATVAAKLVRLEQLLTWPMSLPRRFSTGSSSPTARD
jgi:hypothetical protein